jgi:WD40 repeat protein
MRRLALLLLLLSLALCVCLGNGGPPLVPLAARADTPPADKAEEPEQPDRPPEKVALVLDPGGHTDTIVTVAFTPDDKELMTASKDGTVRFWDLETGETVQVLRPPIKYVDAAAALSPDGRLVAIGGKTSKDPAAKDWSIFLLKRDDDRMRTLAEHDNYVETLAFSPDGKWLAVAGRRRLPGPGARLVQANKNNLRLWDLERGETAFVWKDDATAAHAVAFSPDGKLLATVSDPGFGRDCAVWSLATKERVATITGHAKTVWGVAWTPDGKQIATTGNDGVRLWDVEGKTSTLVSKLGAGARGRTGFSGDGKKLLYWGTAFAAWPGDEPLRVAVVRDLTSGEEAVFPGHKNELSAGAVSHDGKWAATAGGSAHEIYYWRTATPADGYRKLGGRGYVKYGVGLSADGKRFAWGNRNISPESNFQAHVPLDWSFSLEDLTLRKISETAKAGDYRRAELSRDELTLELHRGLKTLEVKRDGKTLVAHPFVFPVLCATLLPGQRVAVGTANELNLLAADGAPGKNICKLLGHQGGVAALAASADGRYLLSAGRDTTLRLWDLEPLKADPPPKELRPTLSFFTAGPKYWIAWTEEGYYAASPDGEQIMGWLKDNGPERQLSFYSADQFRKSLHKPEALKVLLEQGGLEKALAWVKDKERKPLLAANILPPRVTITEPARTVTLGADDKPDLTIKATAEPDGGNKVTGLQLLVDGRPYPTAPPTVTRDPKTGKVEASWKMRVPADRHRLSVLAQTDTAEGRSTELGVTNNGKPPPPKLFFLGIGIDAYPRDLKLNCAVSDATALEKALLAQHQVNPLFGEVLTLTVLDPKATREGIRAGLKWLQGAQAEDVVVIFYAGHGKRDRDGDFQLLAVNYDESKPEETTVAGKELKAALAALESRRVLLILDACHSGAISTALATDALAGDLKQPECGVTVLCAAQGNETSGEDARSGHGYFTKWLLDGLKGSAGTNKAGEITLARLYVHVEEKVPAETDDGQHPVLVGLSAIRSFALAKAAKTVKP